MVRTNQGGSVLGFVVIGVILAALLAGGVYFVRQQTAQPVPTEPQQTTPQPAPKPETKKSQSDKKDKTAPQKKNDQSASSQTNGSTSSAKELPKTGPAELLGSLVALGLLSAVAVSYMRSRRPELSL